MPDSRPTRYATPRQLFAWATFDWAATPFFVVVITFIFAAYFTQAVAANPVDGTAQWGWAMTCAAADHRRPGARSSARSPMPAVGASRGCSPSCCWRRPAWSGLWEIEPHPEHVLLALILVVIANVGSEVAQTFYNSMLPELSPPDQVGRWSGLGWGLGYIAGIVGLVILLFGFVQRVAAPVRPRPGDGREHPHRRAALCRMVACCSACPCS